jgi:hypothetical protein
MSRPQFAPRAPHRAVQILTSLAKRYPYAWRDVDEFRAARGKQIHAWPSWCFLPLSGAEAIVSAEHDPGPPPRRTPIRVAHHIGVLGALAAWRMTQGIYRFDEDLAQALDETAPPDEVPTQALYHLPEWCVYLETPGRLSIDGRALAGAWLHLDWDQRGFHELRVVQDIEGDPATSIDEDRLIPIPVILGEGSIRDALARVTASGTKVAHEHGYAVLPSLEDVPGIVDRLWPLVSRVLYLCVDEPDLGGTDRPRRPQPTRTKQGYKLFPADSVRRWDVGTRIGAALRSARERYEREDREALTSGRARPRPHVRRAHFHGFWTGPRADESKQELRVRWLPPIPVNTETPDELPATVHPVRP